MVLTFVMFVSFLLWQFHHVLFDVHKQSRTYTMISMRAIWLLFPCLLVFINFINAQSVASFTSPKNGSFYAIGQTVNVTVAYQSTVPINVTQTCGSLPPVLKSTKTNTATNFTLSSPFIGNCTYSGVFVDTTIPSPQSVYIVVQGRISIVNPAVNSKLISNSTTTVSISFTPSFTPTPVVNATLNCPDSGFPPVSVEMNDTSAKFPVPKKFYGNCNFTVTDPSGMYQTATNSPVYVTQTLIIEQPLSDQVIEYPNNVTTLIRTGFVDAAVIVNMSLKCSTFQETFYYSIPSNTLTQIPSNTSNIGTCTYLVASNPDSSYLILPKPIQFSIKVTIIDIVAPTVINSGIPFAIGLFTPQPFADDVVTIVNLNCSDVVLQSYRVLLNAVGYETYNGTSRNDCIFNVFPASRAINYFESPVNISNPSFATPINGSSYDPGQTVTVTLDNAAAYSDVTVTQTCGSDVVTKAVDSNFQAEFEIPNSYTGTCTYSAVTLEPSYIEPVSIRSRYDLIFVTYPSEIMGGIPFTIRLKTSVTDMSIPHGVDVSLLCRNGALLVYTWPNIFIGVPVSLLLPVGTPGYGACVLSTPAANPYYVRATVPVELIQSPFGGEVYPINELEIEIFLNSITVAFDTWPYTTTAAL